MQIFAIAGNPGGEISDTGAGDLVAVSTVSPMAAYSETLLLLCRHWSRIHKSPPPEPPRYCADILRTFYDNNPSVFDDRLLQNYGTLRNSESTGERVVGIDVMDNLHFSGRSLSLIGVLGGVLFILLMIAFVTCIKHRRKLRDEEGEGLNLDAISTQLRHLNQARASQHLLSMLGALPDLPGVSPPPDYETVVKQREKEQEEWENLPSYSEAIGDNRVLETVLEEPTELEPGADEILENRECSSASRNVNAAAS